MAYTEIADYILDDFWGFAEVNAIKNNVEYILCDRDWETVERA